VRLRIRNAVVRQALPVLCALLSGCAGSVVPLPSYQSAGPVAWARTNIDAQTSSRIAAGQTTRTEVLLMLGEPDGRAPDDSWFTYGSVARLGGVKWAAMVEYGDWNSSVRLIIRFDTHGVVSATEFSQRDCSEWRRTCLDARGTDLLVVDYAGANSQGK